MTTDLASFTDGGATLEVYRSGEEICLFIHTNGVGRKFWLQYDNLEKLIDVLQVETGIK